MVDDIAWRRSPFDPRPMLNPAPAVMQQVPGELAINDIVDIERPFTPDGFFRHPRQAHVTEGTALPGRR